MSVRNKVVIVTGGAQGIGRFVARTFAAEGAHVTVADIASMDTVGHELTELVGQDFLAIKTDVTNESAVRSMVEQTYRRWGRIDVLVNDAGIVPHFSVGAPRWPRVRDMQRDFFARVVETNLIGTFLCTKHVIPYMESLNNGHIISFGQGNVSEQRNANANARPNIGSGAYNTTKVAIRAFMRYVAEEEREFNICAMSMGPGGSTSSTPVTRPAAGPGTTGGGGGIVTEDSPEWTHETSLATVDQVGNRYVIASEAPMEFSGHQVQVKDGKLEIASD